MNVLVSFGTRPELIKLAPVYHELKSRDDINVWVCSTGQHYEMLNPLIEFFQVKIDYDLAVMSKSKNLNSITSEVISNLDKILEKNNFDIIIVQGDTTSAMSVALTGFNRGIRVTHVEAGLRTYDLYPFPEEMNRQLISRLSWLHCAPTKQAYSNLLKEGINEKQIILSGNTVIDSLKRVNIKLEAGWQNNEIAILSEKIDWNKKILIVTCHRRENFGKGIKSIISAVKTISLRRDTLIVWLTHLNPNVKTVIESELSNNARVLLFPPLTYPSFIWLLSHSSLVLTDSGGIQEEAAFYRIPTLITRRNTERMESVKTGLSIVVGADKESILNKFNQIIMSNEQFEYDDLYGNGNSSKIIVDSISDLF